VVSKSPVKSAKSEFSLVFVRDWHASDWMHVTFFTLLITHGSLSEDTKCRRCSVILALDTKVQEKRFFGLTVASCKLFHGYSLFKLSNSSCRPNMFYVSSVYKVCIEFTHHFFPTSSS